MKGYFTSTPCFVIPGESDEFNHSFGGPPAHKGAHPDGSEGPLHLLYNFNLNDPKLGMKLKRSSWLPLYHPLAFDGATLAYQILSDTEIEIIDLHPSEYSLGWQYPEVQYDAKTESWTQIGPNYPKFFTKVPVALQPLTYEEHRAELFKTVYYSDVPRQSDSDKEIITKTSKRIRIGGYFPQYYAEGTGNCCANKKCRLNSSPGRLEPIMFVPEQPVPGAALWSANYNSDVEIVFRICPQCETIHTYNICS